MQREIHALSYLMKGDGVPVPHPVSRESRRQSRAPARRVTVAKLKFKKQDHLTRDEAADRLTELAESLRKGEKFELERNGEKIELELDIPKKVVLEFEVEFEDDETEIELEIKWAPLAAHAESTRAGPDSRS